MGFLLFDCRVFTDFGCRWDSIFVVGVRGLAHGVVVVVSEIVIVRQSQSRSILFDGIPLDPFCC